MPVVHSQANGQFVKSGAAVGTAGKKLDKGTIAKINAGTYTGPPPKAKKAKKARAAKGSGSGKVSAANAAKDKARAALQAKRAAAAKTRAAATKKKFAASQHKKAVHKAVTAKRHVMLLEKRAAAAGATADDKLRATQARRTFTNANAAFDKSKAAAKTAQASFNARHATQHKPQVKSAASGKVIGVGSASGRIGAVAAKSSRKSPVHRASHSVKSAPKIRGFKGGRRGF